MTVGGNTRLGFSLLWPNLSSLLNPSRDDTTPFWTDFSFFCEETSGNVVLPKKKLLEMFCFFVKVPSFVSFSVVSAI